MLSNILMDEVCEGILLSEYVGTGLNDTIYQKMGITLPW